MKPKIPVTQAVLLLSPHFPDAIIIPTRSNFSVCAEAGLSGLEIWLPLACLVAGFVFGSWGWSAWLIFPLQMMRRTVRNPGPLSDLFQALARFPEGLGQVRFMRDRLIGPHAYLIEYK